MGDTPRRPIREATVSKTFLFGTIEKIKIDLSSSPAIAGGIVSKVVSLLIVSYLTRPDGN
jgi:hypothetical protein